MIQLSNYKHFVESHNAVPFVDEKYCPRICEGQMEVDTLCPLSELTGHRTPILSLLHMALSDKNARLLETLLQELPVVRQMEGVSDEDKIALLASRFGTGTLAENDRFLAQLSSVADVLFPGDSDIKNEVVDSSSSSSAEKISFEGVKE